MLNLNVDTERYLIKKFDDEYDGAVVLDRGMSKFVGGMENE